LAARALADLRRGDGEVGEMDEVVESMIARHATAGQASAVTRLAETSIDP
jgi:hypothetical protein